MRLKYSRDFSFVGRVSVGDFFAAAFLGIRFTAVMNYNSFRLAAVSGCRCYRFCFLFPTRLAWVAGRGLNSGGLFTGQNEN